MKTAVEWLFNQLSINNMALDKCTKAHQEMEQKILEKAKEMEEEQIETHKYTEFDLISAFEYGWNQRHFDKTDEDELQQIQKRFIQSINETKQQEQCIQ